MSVRVNVGCGATPTPGWRNFDNSLTVRLSRHRVLLIVACRLGLVATESSDFAKMATTIEWADARRRLPLESESVDALYSSHMVEHLTPAERDRFLAEALRVLSPGGVIRVVVPDLGLLVRTYCQTGDAEEFVRRTFLVREPTQGLRARIRRGIVGDRHHMWMYDGSSLCTALESAGFVSALVVPPGSTQILDPGSLDLREREEESVYVEAVRP